MLSHLIQCHLPPFRSSFLPSSFTEASSISHSCFTFFSVTSFDKNPGKELGQPCLMKKQEDTDSFPRKYLEILEKKQPTGKILRH